MSAAPPEASAPAGEPAWLFAALGDSARLHLVARLSSEGPLSITGLSAGARITRQAVTKHLHVLQRAGLVDGSRRGREQIWELRPAGLQEAQSFLEAVARRWDRALWRLRDYVEGPASGEPPAPSPT